MSKISIIQGKVLIKQTTQEIQPYIHEGTKLLVYVCQKKKAVTLRKLSKLVKQLPLRVVREDNNFKTTGHQRTVEGVLLQ